MISTKATAVGQAVFCPRNQPWLFIGRTVAEAEAPILWSPDAKSRDIGKDPDAGKDGREKEKGSTQDEMVRQHHRLNGGVLEQTSGEWTEKPGMLQSMLCSVTQSCLTLFDSVDYSPPGSSVHGDSPGKNTGWVAMPPLQGIFPTQGSNPGLLHFRQILYHLSHQGSPWTLEWVAYPLSRGPSQPRDQTRLSCIAGGFFISWATREALQTMGSQRVTHWTMTTFSITQGGQAYKKKDAGVLLPKIVKQGRKWAVYIRKVNY